MVTNSQLTNLNYVIFVDLEAFNCVLGEMINGESIRFDLLKSIMNDQNNIKQK